MRRERKHDLYTSHEEREKRRSEELKKLEQRTERVADMLAQCFSTEAGKFALNYIMQISGFQSPSSVFHAVTGEIIPSSSAYRDGQRSIYTGIRNVLIEHSPHLLQETEFKKYT